MVIDLQSWGRNRSLTSKHIRPVHIKSSFQHTTGLVQVQSRQRNPRVWSSRTHVISDPFTGSVRVSSRRIKVTHFALELCSGLLLEDPTNDLKRWRCHFFLRRFIHKTNWYRNCKVDQHDGGNFPHPMLYSSSSSELSMQFRIWSHLSEMSMQNSLFERHWNSLLGKHPHVETYKTTFNAPSGTGGGAGVAYAFGRLEYSIFVVLLCKKLPILKLNSTVKYQNKSSAKAGLTARRIKGVGWIFSAISTKFCRLYKAVDI